MGMKEMQEISIYANKRERVEFEAYGGGLEEARVGKKR